MDTNVLDELESNAEKRGAYSTPAALAQFLVNWAIRSQNDSAIDISCGDGVFLEAIAYRLVFLGGDISAIKQITGIEIDPATAKKAYDLASQLLSGTTFPFHPSFLISLLILLFSL